jgi:Undecaprenyl-phosphate glucose phosphotransferase
MTRRVGLILTLWLVVLDVTAFAAGFFLAFRLYLATKDPLVPAPPFEPYRGMMAIQVVTLLAVFFLNKLYHRSRSLSGIDEFTVIVSAVSVGTVMSVAVTSLIFNRLEYSRWIVVFAWLLTVVLVLVGRGLHTGLSSALRRRGLGADRVLVVGGGEIGWAMVERIRRVPGLGYQVVGVVDDRPPSPPFHGGERGGASPWDGGERGGASSDGVPVLGGVQDLERIIEEQQIDEVIIALPEASHDQILDIISRCHREKVSIKVFPDVFQIMASEVTIGHLDGLPLLTVRDVALRGWKLTLKRAVDIVVSVIALVVLSPLLLLIALAIKLDSPGPVFYSQERMGLDAKPFKVVKFRTMRADAEAETGPVWARKNDPRTTRVGQFLRRLSLDELPQFINVLLGEMSVVGPRPERPVFVEQFRQSIPRYMDRHREKAGITGWAQVNGLRGDTSIWERTKYDIWYIENWSLLLDFKIMLKTVVRIVSDRNAY